MSAGRERMTLRWPAPALLVGDAVRLHSGGPVMTVFAIEADHRIWCNWLVGYEMRRAALPSAALARVQRSTAS